MANWFRDLLLPSLIVTLLGAVATFVVPLVFQKEDLEVSYQVEGAADLIDELHRSGGANIQILVNGKEAKSLFGYAVRLWNSGKKPIKDFRIRFNFDKTDEPFEVLTVTHKTKPEFEFGTITPLENTTNSRKIGYELLNPDDEDTVRFLSNQKAQINVYAKAEGVLLINRTNEKTDWKPSMSWIVLAFFFVTALLALGLRRLF